MHVSGENPWPVLAWPKAWSPGIPGPVEADVVSLGGKSRDEIESMDLKGKIVLIQSPRELSEPFDAEARRLTAEDLLKKANGSAGQARPRRGGRPSRSRMRRFQRLGALMQIVHAKQPLAVLERGFKGDYGTVFVSGASIPGNPLDGAPPRVAPRQDQSRSADRALGGALQPALPHAGKGCSRAHGR